MFSIPFVRAAGERALRTVAQALLALWVVDGFNAMSVNWAEAGGIGLGAGILSVLTSVVATGTRPASGPSFGTETPVVDRFGTRPGEHRNDTEGA